MVDIFTGIKMVVFDMAGTTIDEGGIVYKTLREILKKYNVTCTDEEFNKYHGINKVEVLDSLLKKNKVNVCLKKIEAEFYELLHNNYKQFNLQAMHGCKEVFTKLRKRGIKVCLNTGYSKEMASYIINKVKLDDYIDGFITSDQVKMGRPYPYMIHKLMEQFSILSGDSIIKVGDTCIDILEGKNAHTKYQISVLSGADNYETLATKNPYLIIKDVSDLAEYITN